VLFLLRRPAQVYKSRIFSKSASKEGLGDAALMTAVNEMERGLIDVELGGHVVKKRVALGGRGKRGGVRVLIAYKAEHNVFFVYGFAKNDRANISDDELRVLKSLARNLLGASEKAIANAMKTGAFFDLENRGRE
jgi:hypothetical protein